MLFKYFGVCWNGTEPGKRKSAKIIKNPRSKCDPVNFIPERYRPFFSDPGPDNLEIRFAQTQIILISNKMK